MSLEKILIVEDERVVRNLLESIFARHKYSVTCAATLAEATAAVQRESFDLLMLDLRLPDGDGQKFLEKMAALPERPLVVIGRDTRLSGPMIFAAVSAGLLSVGVDVVNVEVATTPSIAIMGTYLKADASCVITASHNPPMWNGIKFLRPDGRAYSPEKADAIKKAYNEKPWMLPGLP